MKVVNCCTFLHRIAALVILGHTTVVLKTFDRTRLLDGSVICALDDSSLVISYDELFINHSGNTSFCVSPLALCAWQCTARTNCTNFNLKDDKKTCELFDFNPRRCSSLSGCYHLQVSGLKSCPQPELHLNCSQSASGAGLFVGEFLKLTCYITYIGMLTPSMQWTDNNNSLITNATTMSIDGLISSFILIPAYMNFTPPITFKINVINSTKYDNYSWSSESVPVGCPPGFRSSIGSNTCYVVIYKKYNWETSVHMCEQRRNGSYLTAITSDAEQMAITNYLNKQNLVVCSDSTGYIGGHMIWTSYQRKDPTSCNDTDSPFVWKPTSSIIIEDNYTLWKPGEPNCFKPQEVCMFEPSTFGYSGVDGDCSLPFCPLCEYGPF